MYVYVCMYISVSHSLFLTLQAEAKKPQALDYITQGAEMPKGVAISPLRTLTTGR